MLKKSIVKSSSEDIKIPVNWQGVLSELGYKLASYGKDYRTQAVYRDGKNASSIIISPSSGTFYDFGTNSGGSIVKLIALTRGIEEYEVNEVCEKIKSNPTLKFEDVIDIPKTFSDKCLDNTFKNYEYFEGRKISKDTQVRFEACVPYRGPLSGRITFPIRDFRNRIIGFTGRDPNWKKGSPYPKWLIFRPKRHFVYSHKTATPAIKEGKSIILVESVADLLSFYECGIKNVICLFGLNISKSVIKYVLSLNPQNIIISTNKDGEENDFHGEEGARKLKDKLLTYFSEDKIKISLPDLANDWNDILNLNGGEEHIKKWYKDTESSGVIRKIAYNDF